MYRMHGSTIYLFIEQQEIDGYIVLVHEQQAINWVTVSLILQVKTFHLMHQRVLKLMRAKVIHL